jgi:hypothetical protein
MQQMLCSHLQVDSLNLVWNPTNSGRQKQPHCHTHTLYLQLIPTLTSMHSVRQLLSLYSRFYKVTMLESTNATGEGKNTNVFLDV